MSLYAPHLPVRIWRDNRDFDPQALQKAFKRFGDKLCR